MHLKNARLPIPLQPRTSNSFPESDLLPNSQQVHFADYGRLGCARSLIYQFLWSYAYQNRSIHPLPIDSCVGLAPESDTSLGISTEYIGPEVLAQQGVWFGVLAQVTKAKPTVRVGRTSKVAYCE